MNENPLNNVSVDDLLNEAGYEPPKEETPPIDVAQTPQDLIQKAQVPEDKTFLEKLFQNASPEFSIAPGIGGIGTVAEGTADKAKPQIAKGAAQGVVGIAQMASQFMYDLADGADNIAHSYGLTENELLTPYKIDWKSKLQSPDDDIGTKMTAELVQYMAPGMGIAKAFKLGMASAGGVNVALDYMLMDPNQDRLADLVTNNFPSLRNWIAVGNSLKYLEHNDKDTDWEGRFKNGLESFMVNIMPASPSIVRAFSNYLKAQRGVKVMIDAGKAAPGAIPRVAKITVEATPEAIPGTTKIVAEGSAEAAKEIPKVLPSFASPILNTESKFFGKFKDLGGKTLDEIAPRATEAQWAEEAGAILNDEAKLAAMLDKPFESFTAAEGVAYKRLVTDSSNELYDGLKTIDLDDEESLNLILDKLTALSGVETASEAAGRVQGQALRARQLDVAGTGTTLKEFESLVLGDAKLNLMKDAVRLAGGKEQLKKLLTDIKTMPLNNLSDVARAEWLVKVSSEKTLPKMNRSVQYAMYNGMLGLKSFTTSTTGNLVNTVVGATDQLAKYGIREVRNSDIYRKLNKLPLLDDVTKNAESLRHAMVLKGYRDGFLNSIAGFGRPELNRYKTTKLNMNMLGLTAKENMGITPDMNAAWQTWGTLMQTVGLNGQTTKLLGKADEFFGGINYHMKLSDHAAEYLIKNKIPTEEIEAATRKFLADPPTEAHRAAMDFAEKMVLAKQAPADSSVGKYILENGFVKTLIPFSNVTYNAAQFAVEHSPFAWASGSVKKAFKTGSQLEKDEALAKIIVGTTAIGGIAMLSSMGEVTGAASPNYRVNQATADSGKEYKPYSIYGISFARIDTVRPWIDLGHTLAQAAKYLEEEKYEELSINVAAAVSNFFVSNQLLENVATVTDLTAAIANGSVNTADEAEKFVVDFIGRFSPAVGREAAQVVEQVEQGEVYKRKLKETGEGLKGLEHFTAQLKNQLRADVPWFNQDLAVQRNIFAEPQLAPSMVDIDPLWFLNESTSKESEVMQKLRVLAHGSEQFPDLVAEDAVKLNIAVPGAVVRIPKTTTSDRTSVEINGEPDMPFEMTPKQHDRYLEYYGNLHEGASGPTLRQTMDKYLSNDSLVWKQLTAEQSAKSYKKAIQEAYKPFTVARQRANMLIMRDPEFRAAYEKRREQFQTEQKQFLKPSPMLGQ